jgi:hypothetical protein
MKRPLFLLIAGVLLVSCSGLPAQRGTELNRHELRSLTRTIEHRARSCYVPITLVTSCPVTYQHPERGECLLAFVTGQNADDESAIFYTVYRQGGVFRPYEHFSSGQSYSLVGPLQLVECTS